MVGEIKTAMIEPGDPRHHQRAQQHRRQHAQEQQKDRRLVKKFVQACQAGDVKAFWECVDYFNDFSVLGWELAFKRLGRMPPFDVAPEIRRAFVSHWVCHKSLRLKLGDDGAVLKTLRLMMPKYAGPGDVKLFRGDNYTAWRFRQPGFSWTPDRETAKRLALELWNIENDDAVVLETLAPAAAIICVPNTDFDEMWGEHFNENEYILDRRFLTAIKLVERIPRTAA